MSAETIREYASIPATGVRVDKEAGVIHDVRVLGTNSKNGRVYPPATIAAARSLYEAAKVFVDHGAEGKSRSYRDRIGTLKNVRVAQDGGLIADLCVNKKHSIAEQLFDDAERNPEAAGLSHEILGKTTRKDGKVIVDQITKVESVDLVAAPATVTSLFEQEQQYLDSDPELKRIAEHAFSAESDIRRILLDSNISLDGKRSQLAEVLSALQGEVKGLTHITEITKMELKDLTLEQLKEQRADIVALLTGTDEVSKLKADMARLTEEVKAATDIIKVRDTELASLKAKEAEALKATTIQEELKAAKLDAAKVPEVFMEQLKGAADTAGRARIIEALKPLLAVKPVAPITTAAPFAPVTDGGTVSHDSFSELFSK